MLSKKLPRDFQDKLNLALGSMDVPNLPKLMQIMEEQRGAILMRCSTDMDTPSKKKGNPATAATAVGKPGKSKMKQSCFVNGCDDMHLLYKCPKFHDLSVSDRKSIVESAGCCWICLQKGHKSVDCPKADVIGGCKVDNCGQAHNNLLHESVDMAAAVYEVHTSPEANLMLMLQQLDVVDINRQKVPVNAMWDTGLTTTMVTQSLVNKLQLPFTGRSARISLADGEVKRLPTVKLCLVDRHKNYHILEPVVVPLIGPKEAICSINPVEAAVLFDMKPEDFTLVDGQVDLLVGHLHPSMFPYSVRSVGETMLYSSLFGSGYFAVSANGLAKSRYVVCSDVQPQPTVGAACDAIIEPVGSACNAADEPFGSASAAAVDNMATAGVAVANIDNDVSCAAVIPDDIGNDTVAVENIVTAGIEPLNDSVPAGQEPTGVSVPAGQEPIRVLVPAGQEPTGVSVPAGQEPIRNSVLAGQEPTGVSVPAGQKPVDDSKFYDSHTFITCPGAVMNQESTWLLPTLPPDTG